MQLCCWLISQFVDRCHSLHGRLDQLRTAVRSPACARAVRIVSNRRRIEMYETSSHCRRVIRGSTLGALLATYSVAVVTEYRRIGCVRTGSSGSSRSLSVVTRALIVVVSSDRAVDRSFYVAIESVTRSVVSHSNHWWRPSCYSCLRAYSSGV